MKVLSSKNQKYINKSKIIFNKNLNIFKENIKNIKFLKFDKNILNSDKKRKNLNLN